ncbi:MAG: hypothetical protein LBM01_02255 [Christensenellaceae bacterium]|jgi:hypothetical protein|nr:hypothetical protein [Christensenellaceae bacterium]
MAKDYGNALRDLVRSWIEEDKLAVPEAVRSRINEYNDDDDENQPVDEYDDSAAFNKFGNEDEYNMLDRGDDDEYDDEQQKEDEMNEELEEEQAQQEQERLAAGQAGGRQNEKVSWKPGQKITVDLLAKVWKKLYHDKKVGPICKNADQLVKRALIGATFGFYYINAFWNNCVRPDEPSVIGQILTALKEPLAQVSGIKGVFEVIINKPPVVVPLMAILKIGLPFINGGKGYGKGLNSADVRARYKGS